MNSNDLNRVMTKVKTMIVRSRFHASPFVHNDVDYMVSKIEDPSGHDDTVSLEQLRDFCHTMALIRYYKSENDSNDSDIQAFFAGINDMLYDKSMENHRIEGCIPVSEICNLICMYV
jgi:hypothetical protein